MVFIRDLVTEEGLTKCNVNIIPIKISFFIDMIKSDNYEETKFHSYHRLICKLIYLTCNIRPDIVFIIDNLANKTPTQEKTIYNRQKEWCNIRKE